VLRADRLAGPAEAHLRDDAMGAELPDDVVPLRNGVGVGRVGDLEREARQGEAGVPGAGADPVDARRVGPPQTSQFPLRFHGKELIGPEASRHFIHASYTSTRIAFFRINFLAAFFS
jgi:hypothetical protein